MLLKIIVVTLVAFDLSSYINMSEMREMGNFAA